MEKPTYENSDPTYDPLSRMWMLRIWLLALAAFWIPFCMWLGGFLKG